MDRRSRPTASPGPVPGCVYDGHRLDGGIPLGGLGTGYFTLEGSGLIGHCSIFNDVVPPRADFSEWLTLRIAGAESLPLSTADVACWGHHPVADLVCRFEAKGLELGIRAFSPLILGNSVDSNIPAALFEIEIRNNRAEALDLELIVEPPNASASPTYERGPHDVALTGDNINVVNTDGQLTGRIARTIAANGSSRVRLVFAWHSPCWRDSGREPHVNQYSLRYEDAAAAAGDAWSSGPCRWRSANQDIAEFVGGELHSRTERPTSLAPRRLPLKHQRPHQRRRRPVPPALVATHGQTFCVYNGNCPPDGQGVW